MLSDYNNFIEERYGRKIRTLQKLHDVSEEVMQLQDELIQKYNKAVLIQKEINKDKEKIDEDKEEIEKLKELLRDYGLEIN